MKPNQLLNINTIRVFLLFFILFFFSQGFSQNLVRNWSFEDTISCPTLGGQIDKSRHWFTTRGGGGSSELFNPCNYNSITAPGFVGIPANSAGYQMPFFGNSYAGISTYFNNSETREYIETKLSRVLEPTVNYYIEFWVSLSNESNFAIENIGAYFSTDTLRYSSNITTLIDAQVENNTGIISDTLNWVKVSGYFKPPNEGYQFLTIGNFQPSDSTNKTLVGWHAYEGAYYYIENVVVIDSALQHTIGFESLKFKSFKFQVYPNPASGIVNIEFDDKQQGELALQIIDIMGREVFTNKYNSTDNIKIDVSRFSGGIYFLRIIGGDDNIYSQKIIIN